MRGTGSFHYPWGEAELVAKVARAGFAFIGRDGGSVSLTWGRDAEEVAEWRDRWNSVDWTGKVTEDELRELIDSSYEAIVAARPRSKRPPVG